MNHNKIFKVLSIGLGLTTLGLSRNILTPKTIKLKENNHIQYLDVKHKNYFLFDHLSYWKDCNVDPETMKKTHKFSFRPICLLHIKVPL